MDAIQLKLSAIIIGGFIMLAAGSSLFDKKNPGNGIPASEGGKESVAIENKNSTRIQGKSTMVEDETSVVKDPWLNGYPYRKDIVITNGTSTQSNYQVAVTVDTAILAAAGKLQTDCDDIRFAAADGYTLMDYWIESGCNTATTTIWAEIPSIANGTSTIYMYYGNASSTALSNADNTLIFYDDFETGNFSKWTTAQSLWSVATSTAYEGTYAAKANPGSSNRVLSKTQSVNSVLLHGYSMVDVSSSSNFAPAIPYNSRNYYTHAVDMFSGHFKYYDGVSYFNLPTDATYEGGNWYRFDAAIDFENSLWRWRINGVDKGIATLKDADANILTASDSLVRLVSMAAAATVTGYLDKFWVTKFIYPEPSASTGSETALVTQAGVGATDWSWKMPVIGDRVKNGTSTNWNWTVWQDDSAGLIVPYSTSTDWAWYPR